jgi:hypothetical protein
MERQEILEAMTELKLYGVRASFDEIAGKGLARRDEIFSPSRQSNPRRTYPPAGALDQLSHERRQVPGSSRILANSSSPTRRSMQDWCANSPPAPSWTHGAM